MNITRINIIPPAELYDQHLVAEYREIFMVGPALNRSLNSKGWNINRIPNKFKLNVEHVLFFYDKGEYLYKRYQKLIKEIKQRGMKPNPNREFKSMEWPDHFFNNWKPSEDDMNIIRERIKLRVSGRPGWYRMMAKIIR